MGQKSSSQEEDIVIASQEEVIISSSTMVHNTKRYDMLNKIALLGDLRVGKTSLLTRFGKDSFNSYYDMTIGTDFADYIISIDDPTHLQSELHAKLQIWDLAGHERFRCVIKPFIRRMDGVILCFALDDLQSFNHIKSWLKFVRDNAADSGNSVLLVGTKSDVSERKVSESRITKFCEQTSIPYLETSSKNNIGVGEAFIRISTMITERIRTLDY